MPKSNSTRRTAIELNHENLILESKNFDLKTNFSRDSVQITCGTFLDVFPPGITCNRKLWPKVISYISRRLRESVTDIVLFQQRYYVLTILLKIRFIMDVLLEILKNFGVGSEYRAFKLCAIIATYTFIFIYLKTHWVRSL